MKTANDIQHASDKARQQFNAPATPLHLLADFSRMVWLHYACDAHALQSAVPFDLDVRQGRGYVSVIAGTMRRLRPQLAVDTADLTPGLDRDQPFVAVRAAVQWQGQPARFNLAWWTGASVSPLLAADSYGLPPRAGVVQLQHTHERGTLQGSLRQGDATLAYEAEIDPSASFEPAVAGELDAFLLERYAILTAADGVRRAHWLWHRPWARTPIDVAVTDDAMLRRWLPAGAALVAGHYAPGACDVWVSRPLCVQGASCARVWGDLPSDAAMRPQPHPATSDVS